jgi:hypothetical protein
MYYRLCDADRDEYGGPEWLELDPDALLDFRASQLAAWEKDMGQTIVSVVSQGRNESANAIRGQLWIALKLAGVNLEWAEFDPRALKAELRREPPGTAAGKEPPPASSPSTDSPAAA